MQLLAVAALACTTQALKPMPRRAWMLGAPAALALPQPSRAVEMTKTASGLEYYDVKVGQGDGPAKIEQTVTIDYIAWLNGFEGKEFSRFEKPIKVKLGEKKVAPGLEECLLADMNIGGTRRCKLPPSLAYGATGYPKSGDKAGSIIPPNADVYFQVRLRSVVLSKGLGFGLNVI